MTKVLVDQQLLCDLFNFNNRDPEYQDAYAAIRDLLEAPELPPSNVKHVQPDIETHSNANGPKPPQ
jgi:hypothetical protein